MTEYRRILLDGARVQVLRDGDELISNATHVFFIRAPARSASSRVGQALPSVAQEPARAIGSTDSDRTPCAPWIRTPSISAVAEGPVWNEA